MKLTGAILRVACECTKNSCHTEAHVQTNSMQMATFSVAMYISTV